MPTQGSHTDVINLFQDYKIQTWNISSFDFSNNSQIFTSNLDDNSCDLKIEFEPGIITIEYFENGSTSVTKTKQLTVE